MPEQSPRPDRFGVPDWETLARMAPISAWTAGLIALGWWARGLVDGDFIEWLRQSCERG